MTYLAKADREVIDFQHVGDCSLLNSSELSYALLVIVLQYTKNDPKRLHEAIGVIESVQHEIHRKYVTPANMQAEFDNGAIE